MVIVGLDYGYRARMTLDEIVGGAPYGATTIAGGDGSRQVSQKELDGGRYQGRRVAAVAAKLHGQGRPSCLRPAATEGRQQPSKKQATTG